MRKIYKFPLEVTNEQRVEMPEGSEILCVQMQHGVPCVWAVGIEGAAKVKRTFAVYGTGHPMITRQADKYVGTVQEHGGALVWHVFVDSD